LIEACEAQRDDDTGVATGRGRPPGARKPGDDEIVDLSGGGEAVKRLGGRAGQGRAHQMGEVRNQREEQR
jgi:hypothetical protein